MVLKKVLLIRFSSIGDIVLTSPVIRCFKQQLNVEIHFITKRPFVELLSANPYITKLWSIVEDIDECTEALKNEHFDAVIDLHNNLRSRHLSILLNKPTIRFNKLNYQKWLAVNLKWDILPNKHLIDRYFESFKKLGLKNDDRGLDFFISDENDLQLTQFNLPASYCVAVLGATYFTKQIPLDLWIKIINSSETKFVLIGGKDEYLTGQELNNLFPDRTTNLAGKLNLSQSAVVIKNAEMVITPDTGMMHIAAAFKKPLHVFWGNTIPKFGMYPYFGKNKNQLINHQVDNLDCRPCSKLGFDSCPKNHFNCMKQQNTDLQFHS